MAVREDLTQNHHFVDKQVHYILSEVIQGGLVLETNVEDIAVAGEQVDFSGFFGMNCAGFPEMSGGPWSETLIPCRGLFGIQTPELPFVSCRLWRGLGEKEEPRSHARTFGTQRKLCLT